MSGSVDDKEKTEIKESRNVSKVNRLAVEKSPYLLQHQYNPVDWYPWGEEAFARARAENKPIFLSIGYSTCHWCHVMERESFENEEIASIINEKYVAIKLDREERPDVDAVYMTFVQGTTGGGGWPMTIFMTPDLLPFVGATYLPPARFKVALQDIALKWGTMEDKLVEEGQNIVRALQQYVAQPRADASLQVTKSILTKATATAAEMFDDVNGGFGAAPKFPRPSVFDVLFTTYMADKESEEGKMARKMALFTLEKIAKGGIQDHLGGGFHRYSVDGSWHVPHFEKMLSDQSQLVLAFLRAVQVAPNPLLESTLRGVLDYVARDMTDDETGGFYSAEDADSEIPFVFGEEKGQKAEGAFYVWTQFDIQLVLGQPATNVFCALYDVHPDGNVPIGSDPHRELEGKNVLRAAKTCAEVAEELSMTIGEVEMIADESKSKLFARRKSRPKPHLDDKLLTAWNGLMIGAFARAANILDDNFYGEVALRAAKFLRDEMWNGSTLFRTYRQGLSTIEGFAEDFAAAIFAFLCVFELTGDSSWLRIALELQSTMDSKFWDAEGGGYYSTGAEDKRIILRKKEDYDSAEPAPSSLAASNLVKMASLTGREEYRERAVKCVDAFSIVLTNSPFAMPLMAAAGFSAIDGEMRVVIAGDPAAEDTKAMIRAFNSHLLPHVALVRLGAEGSGQDADLLGVETKDMVARGGKATAYVCRGTGCMDPSTSVETFAEQLEKLVLET